MQRSLSRSTAQWVTVAIVAAVFAAPSAQAFHAPADHRPAKSGPHWSASPLEIDRLGPKYVRLEHRLAPAPVYVVKIVSRGGFDWGDGAIGAAVSALALASVAGLALLVTRSSRRPQLEGRGEPTI
jgi:hypothetical protein